MKQRITIEQLKELSLEQQEKLREWWKPKQYDVYAFGECYAEYSIYKKIISNLGEWITIEYDGIDYDEAYHTKKWSLPLLSIGQCIELLGNPNIEPALAANWSVFAGTSYFADELIDALWEAVTEVLKAPN